MKPTVWLLLYLMLLIHYLTPMRQVLMLPILLMGMLRLREGI